MTLKNIKIYNTDCLEGLKRIPSNSVQVITGDPPYGIQYGSNEGLYARSKEGVIENYIEVPKSEYKEFSLSWIRECYRVLKDTGTIYIVSGDENLIHILNALEEVGFVKLNHIAWSYQFGTWNGSKWITSYNIILCYVKNIKEYKFNTYCRFSKTDRLETGNSANYKDRESSWYITKEQWKGEVVTTKTKLPYKLYEKMILYSSDPGDTVLDPFLGSGQAAIVSRDLQRKFWGFEKSPENFKFCEYRLRTKKYIISIEEWLKAG
jgi:site-specific DNA-methyltransferase (adenine-specific)